MITVPILKVVEGDDTLGLIPGAGNYFILIKINGNT